MSLGTRPDFALALAAEVIRHGVPRFYNFIGSGISALLSTSRAPFLPPVLSIEVTTKCNLRCFMCPHTFQEYVAEDMSIENFRSILAQVPRLGMLIPQGIGEPLLCEHILPMIVYSKRQGIIVSFNTNGTLLTADRARALIESGLDILSISIDGATEETYRRIRGGGDLTRVVDNLRRMVEIKKELNSRSPCLGIRTVALKENLPEIPQIVDLAASIGITEVFIQDSIGYGGILENSLIDDNDYLALLRCQQKARERGVKVVLENFSRFQKRKRRCVSPWVSPFITRDGFVTPCCVITDPAVVNFGNVLEESFAKIWNGDMFVAFRADFRTGNAPVFCQQCPRY